MTVVLNHKDTDNGHEKKGKNNNKYNDNHDDIHKEIKQK